jgi:hypothetical protein
MKTVLLRKLSDTCDSRYNSTARHEDIELALKQNIQAVAIIPEEDPHKPILLISLGNMTYQARLDRLDNMQPV